MPGGEKENGFTIEPQGLELLRGDSPDPWVGGPDEPMTTGAITLLLIRGTAVCNAARTAYRPSDLRLWEQTAARFVDLTAHIMVLSARARRHRAAKGEVPVPVPVQLQLAGKRLRDVERWCVTTGDAIPRAWRVLQERTRAQVLRRLTRRRPTPSTEVLAAARILAGRRDVGAGLRDQQIRRRFESMAPEAPAESVQDALEIGARAIATTSHVAARAYANELIMVVRKVNAETAQWQADRLIAARYLLVLGATTLEQYPHGRELIARLGQVLAGEVRLDGDVHDACERLCAALEADACTDRLCDLLQRSLTDRGLIARIDREAAAPGVVVSAFEPGTANGCGSFLIDNGRVATEPPRPPHHLSALDPPALPLPHTPR